MPEEVFDIFLLILVFIVLLAFLVIALLTFLLIYLEGFLELTFLEVFDVVDPDLLAAVFAMGN